jgi:hypothetical protein
MHTNAELVGLLMAGRADFYSSFEQLSLIKTYLGDLIVQIDAELGVATWSALPELRPLTMNDDWPLSDTRSCSNASIWHIGKGRY